MPCIQRLFLQFPLFSPPSPPNRKCNAAKKTQAFQHASLDLLNALDCLSSPGVSILVGAKASQDCFLTCSKVCVRCMRQRRGSFLQETLGTWKGGGGGLKTNGHYLQGRGCLFTGSLQCGLSNYLQKSLLNQKSQMTKFIHSLYVSENVTDVRMVGVLRGPQVKSCGAKTVSWVSFSLIKIGNSYVNRGSFSIWYVGIASVKISF